MKLKNTLMQGAVLAGICATAAPAYAQEIEVITVTAAKREQNVQNVPLSMNVVSAKQLQNLGMSDLKDIASQVPGLTIGRKQTVNTYYLRGFGTSAGANPGLSQSVSLYTDGIYTGKAREFMTPMFDVARIEVLRGPQGALLGKNTAAGAVSVISNNPTDEFHAGATVAYLFDRAKGVDFDGYVSGPITDELSARLAVKIVSKDGWLNNIATGTQDPRIDSQSGRLSLAWNPTENVSNIFKYQYDYLAQDGRAAMGVVTPGFPGGITRHQISSWTVNVQPLSGGPVIGTGSLGNLDRDVAHHISNTLTVEYDDLTFVSVTGLSSFVSRSVDLGRALPPESVATDYTDTFGQIAQEFRILSPEDQTVSWIAGVYVDAQSYIVNNIYNYVGFPAAANVGALSSSSRTSANTYSAYATVTWNIREDLRLIGGLRGTQIYRKGNYRIGYVPGSTAYPGLTPFTIADQHVSEGNIDPSITAQYDITPEINVYASFSKGSKGGAFQTANRSANATTFSLKPETSTNYEIGMKSRLWDFLTFNISAYILKFKNLQVSQYAITPTSGGVATLISTNAAEATSKGVEVILDANLDQWIEGLSVNFSGAYNFARYDDFPGATCTFAASQAANGGCASGRYTTGPLAGQFFNAAGLPIGIAPDWSGTMGLHYTHLITDGLKFGGDLSADMQSKSWNDIGAFNPNLGLQPGFTKVNFRIGVGAEDDSWTISLIGLNVFDVFTTEDAYGFISAQVYTPAEGRRLSVQASVKF